MKLLFKFWSWDEDFFPTTEYYIEAKNQGQAEEKKKQLIQLINDHYKFNYTAADFTRVSYGMPWNHLGKIEYFIEKRELNLEELGRERMEAILLKMNNKLVELAMI